MRLLVNEQSDKDRQKQMINLGRKKQLVALGARAIFVLAPVVLLSVLTTCPYAWAETVDAFLEPYRTVEISSPFRDRLDAVHVQDGETVKAGQLLAELGTRVLLAQRAQAKDAAAFHGAIDSAKALIKMRTNRLVMLQELDKSGNARPQEMVTAQTELSIARSQLQSAVEEQQLKKLELAVIEAQLEEKKLRSPFDGVVVKVNRQVTELVGGGDQQPLMTLVQLDPLKAVFHLPQAVAYPMAKSKAVTLEGGGTAITGEIEYISPVINAQSGTVEVRIRIPNPQHKLISGGRCSLAITPK